MALHWDVVLPNGNEEKLVAMARLLGFSELILAYPIDDPLLKDRAREVTKLSTNDLTTRFAALAHNQHEVAKARAVTDIVIARPYPGVFEDKRVTHVLGLEQGKRSDFLHHRNSGLTQVSLREAERKGKTLLVDASALLGGKQHPGVILGRVLQNAQFFRKEPDVPVRVVSCAVEPLRMRAPRDLQDLLRL